MIRRTTVAVFVAILSSFATAVVVMVAMNAPAAVSTNPLDQAAVDVAVNAAVRTIFPAAIPADPPPAAADGFGAYDTATGVWHLRTRAGDPAVFAFGAPGSVPLIGDWDGDGVDTPGIYDPATATLSLRNSNTSGDPDVVYGLGTAGDIPFVGDFDGDGLDAVSVYRPDEGVVLRYDTLGSDGTTLTGPVATFDAGGAGLLPLAGDWDGDGVESVGFYDPETGSITYRNTMGAGDPDGSFTFEASGDVFVLGDWSGDGTDTPGTLDNVSGVQLRFSNTTGGPDETYSWGDTSWIPVAGAFSTLESPVTVALDGAPPSLSWAVESLYLELGNAPAVVDLRPRRNAVPAVAKVDGLALTTEGLRSQIAVVRAGTDEMRAVSDDGWTWQIVGGSLPSQGISQLSVSGPRFVLLIGSDASDPSGNPKYSYGDSLHIYAFDPATNEGAIVGIPRDTAMHYSGTPNVDGMQKVNRTMLGNGPDVLTQVVADETGLPIEGYVQTGFGSSNNPGYLGFTDLIDGQGGLDFLTLYSVASQCVSNPPAPVAPAGSTPQTGAGALAFARERKCVPTDDDGLPIRNGNAVRTLGQGLQLKAAIAQGQVLGSAAILAMVTTMKPYINTDLSDAQLMEFADTITRVDPGPMPTITPSDIQNFGAEAYNLNQGTLPNVLVEGCAGVLSTSGGTTDYATFLVEGNYETFADLADGKLDRVPIYEYSSGALTYPANCPDLLPATNRLAGSSRYDTAVQISKSRYRQGVPVAYIATGENFPDALAGGPVAAVNRGPILLVTGTKIPTATREELSRLKPNRIVVLGGPVAVSEDVKSQLAAYTSGSVTRVSGASRYDTAAEISKTVFTPGVDVAYIATGADFPDALSGGPVAALNRGPILLVTQANIPGATSRELDRLKPKRIVVLGGPVAVGDAVLGLLGGYTAGTVTRLAGPDRYSTAAAISESRFSPGVAVAYVGTGANFPDALSGGPVAGMNSDPILLVTPTKIPGPTSRELTRLKPKRIVVLGGPVAVSDAVLAQLAGYATG